MLEVEPGEVVLVPFDPAGAVSIIVALASTPTTVMPSGELDGDLRPGLPTRAVLDAGCGTGRVAIELARHGITVVGVDAEASMIDTARRRAPELEWHEHDLTGLDLDRTFDLVVMAGNVPLFAPPGHRSPSSLPAAPAIWTERLLIAGFQLGRGYSLEQYDTDTAAAGTRTRRTIRHVTASRTETAVTMPYRCIALESSDPAVALDPLSVRFHAPDEPR